MNESSLTSPQSLDIYRKTCLRYLGYFGLVGKICSPIIPVNFAKTVAMSYMVSDVADKTSKSSATGQKDCERFINASDAMIWQTVTSVLIPGLLIKSLSEHAQKLKMLNRKLHFLRPSTLPYILGIALIPFLSYPIDRSVNFVMDNTYRKLFKSNSRICQYVPAEKDSAFSDLLTLNSTMGDFDKIYENMKPCDVTNVQQIDEQPDKKCCCFKIKPAKQSNGQADKRHDRHAGGGYQTKIDDKPASKEGKHNDKTVDNKKDKPGHESVSKKKNSADKKAKNVDRKNKSANKNKKNKDSHEPAVRKNSSTEKEKNFDKNVKSATDKKNNSADKTEKIVDKKNKPSDKHANKNEKKSGKHEDKGDKKDGYT